jgi:O-antigen/teichoic acid export membrane protein
MNQAWIQFLPLSLRSKLHGRYTLQKILSNTGWLFADRLLRMGVGLLVGVWVARYLGPEQFGLFNYSLSFVALFSTFASLGLDSIVIRDIVRDPSCKNETLGTAFLLKLLGGIATLVATVSILPLLRPGSNLTLWLVGITSAGLIFQAFDTIDFWFQSQVRSKYTVYAKNAIFIPVTLVKIVLIKMQAPLISFAWVGLLETILGAVGLILVYQLNKQSISAWRASFSRAKSLLNDSWALVLCGAAIFIQARIDQVMLGQMVGDAEVGQYSAAMRLIEVFSFIPMIIQSSVAPSVTHSKTQSEALYQENLLNVYRLMTILFLIVSIPVFLFSESIITILYGNEYKTAAMLLSLSAIRLFFTNFGVARSLFITNESLFKYSMVAAIVGSFVNIAFNYLLIPKYASVGSIWATIISFFVTTFVIDFFFKRTRNNLQIMLKAMITPWALIGKMK